MGQFVCRRVEDHDPSYVVSRGAAASAATKTEPSTAARLYGLINNNSNGTLGNLTAPCSFGGFNGGVGVGAGGGSGIACGSYNSPHMAAGGEAVSSSGIVPSHGHGTRFYSQQTSCDLFPGVCLLLCSLLLWP